MPTTVIPSALAINVTTVPAGIGTTANWGFLSVFPAQMTALRAKLEETGERVAFVESIAAEMAALKKQIATLRGEQMSLSAELASRP